MFFGFTSTVQVTAPIIEGSVHLTKGGHRLTMLVVGKNQVTDRFYAGIDKLRFQETAAG